MFSLFPKKHVQDRNRNRAPGFNQGDDPTCSAYATAAVVAQLAEEYEAVRLHEDMLSTQYAKIVLNEREWPDDVVKRVNEQGALVRGCDKVKTYKLELACEEILKKEITSGNKQAILEKIIELEKENITIVGCVKLTEQQLANAKGNHCRHSVQILGVTKENQIKARNSWGNNKPILRNSASNYEHFFKISITDIKLHESLPLTSIHLISCKYEQFGKWFNTPFRGKIVNKVLKAIGHDTVGSFLISGMVDRSKTKTIRFEKRYMGKHIVIYDGAVEKRGRKCTGDWHIKSTCSGRFELILPPLQLASQGQGQARDATIEAQYEQYGKWHPFGFTATIEQTGELSGYAKDGVGDFVIDGHIDIENNALNFEKRYLNKHQVIYQGKIDLKNASARFNVTGKWTISENCNGSFRLKLEQRICNLLKIPIF